MSQKNARCRWCTDTGKGGLVLTEVSSLCNKCSSKKGGKTIRGGGSSSRGETTFKSEVGRRPPVPLIHRSAPAGLKFFLGSGIDEMRE